LKALKITNGALIGFVFGIIIQLGTLYGFHGSLLSQIPLFIFGYAFAALAASLAFLGFSPDANLVPFLFSFSIPVFYALAGALIALLPERWSYEKWSYEK
jgi:hypothetical protein